MDIRRQFTYYHYTIHKQYTQLYTVGAQMSVICDERARGRSCLCLFHYLCLFNIVTFSLTHTLTNIHFLRPHKVLDQDLKPFCILLFL